MFPRGYLLSLNINNSEKPENLRQQEHVMYSHYEQG